MLLSMTYCQVTNYLLLLLCLLHKLPQNLVAENNGRIYFTHRPAVWQGSHQTSLSLSPTINWVSSKVRGWHDLKLACSQDWHSTETLVRLSSIAHTPLHVSWASSQYGAGFQGQGKYFVTMYEEEDNHQSLLLELRPLETEDMERKFPLETEHDNI